MITQAWVDRHADDFVKTVQAVNEYGVMAIARENGYWGPFAKVLVDAGIFVDTTPENSYHCAIKPAPGVEVQIEGHDPYTERPKVRLITPNREPEPEPEPKSEQKPAMLEETEVVKEMMRPLRRWINQNNTNLSDLDELDGIHVDLTNDILEMLEGLSGADLVAQHQEYERHILKVEEMNVTLRDEIHQHMERYKALQEEVELKDIQLLELRRDNIGAGSW